jgi:4-cresol dehydrogenase (hydroxylating)
VLPNTGRDAAAVTELATRVLLEHGFEPQMSLSLATERSAICVTTISYDRTVAGEDDRALQCYNALTEQLLARGYPPYRLNVASMSYSDTGAPHSTVLKKIQRTLDPNGILSPGRYEPPTK